MRADLKALADAVIQTVRAKLAPLVKRLDDMDTTVKALPELVTKELGERVQAAVAELPVPKDGEPGASVTAEDVAPMVAEQVAQQVSKAVQELPAPKDGASITPDDVAPLLAELVAKAVAEIPTPKDGKDADPLVVAEMVSKAVAEIPKPQDGRSVTAEDVAPMVAEEVSKAVAAIPRPKDGESVPAEAVQKMVDEAVTKALSAVAAPKDGEPGRDALQLELQPAIDLEKTYARGTYARHAGGLWRAFEATKGLHGWECVVEGIAALAIQQDGREFTLVAKTSSGDEVRKSIKVAALVDRGVFKAGTDYEAGDGVTWGGSFFIAQKDAPTGHPGEPGSNGWRLAVKRGRDATKGIPV
ncbi:phage portal protein [Acidovorax sp. FG27]|uniref:phage portal protein n=1 Tax=Acidovorax sp. FG27 TaxID=3133652 RepID=UPI0030E8B08B